MSAIELINVSKKFKRRQAIRNYTTAKTSFVNLFRKSAKETTVEQFDALKDINYTIKKGSIFGIIGLNGSGKSTLLKCIAGIYKTDQGSININGRISALIELGAGFHPEFTGRENILINGIILGLSKKEIKRKFDHIVKYAELEDFIDSPVRTYSSGMYMRLGFSVAVNVNPDILLVDEVLSVGDESFSHKCEDKISEFKRQGKTIVIVTHSLSAVEKWCDEVMWLNKGVIKAVGKPRRVIDTYREHVAEIEEQRFSMEHQAAEVAMQSDSSEEKETSGRDEQNSNGAGEENHVNSNGKAGKKEKNRWGTKEIEIYSVKFLDKNNKERHIYNHGDPMTINIKYKANKKVEEYVFGIGIFRPDGVCCYGTNTYIEKVKVPLNSVGNIIFNIENLTLVDGNYFLDVAAHTEDDYTYDYHNRLYSFAVRSKIKDVGIVRLKHQWEFK